MHEVMVSTVIFPVPGICFQSYKIIGNAMLIVVSYSLLCVGDVLIAVSVI
jgi:hypothetical protein